MDTNMPIYSIIINDDDETGVDFISLVTEPAIEIDWVAFNKAPLKFAADVEQKRLIAPFAIPDLKIYRNDNEFGEYYVVFTTDTIQKMSDKFNRMSLSQNVNFQHEDNSKVEGAYVAENWIVEDSKTDKTAKFGFNLPVGTWAGVVKIEDQKFWDEYIKTGEVRGFSVEGMMGMTKIKNNKMKKTKFEDVKTTDGKVLSADTFEVGSDVMLDGQPAPDGEYETEDGKIITVAKGKIAEIADKAEEAPEQPEMAAAPTEPAKPADATAPAADPMAKITELEGMVKSLEDRLKALEDAAKTVAAENQAMASKIEEFSKIPGAKTVATAKPTDSRDRKTFAEAIDRIKSIAKK